MLTKRTGDDSIGGGWLAREYGVDVVQPLRVASRISGSRSVKQNGNHREAYYEQRYRPKATLRGHLNFLLRHERISLEFLARLFKVAGYEELSIWAKDEPTGKYARIAGFLYEWLTNRTLDFSGVTNGGYVDALRADQYLTASNGKKNSRWRVRDNLPGTPMFCPMVLLTDAVNESLKFDISSAWVGLENEFGKDLLDRSAVWITVKESTSSFAIEGETRHVDRIRRFAAVLETEVGRHPDVLTEETLLQLQHAILGDSATRHGMRQSPIFVGETRGMNEVVHYVAPRWDVARGMLDGLAALDKRTHKANPIMRAAVMSFGFVYIHPLSDGNGRVSRFLINDVLRRDGALPKPFVIPVSAVISRSMGGYDKILEIFSKPLMRRYATAYHFGKNVRYEDGFSSTFHFDAYVDAESAWRYPDLTDHVEYLAGVIKATFDVELRQEARELRAHQRARQGVNEWIEGPDQDLDRIIRSVRENGWVISNKLISEFPLLTDQRLRVRIVEVIRNEYDI